MQVFFPLENRFFIIFFIIFIICFKIITFISGQVFNHMYFIFELFIVSRYLRVIYSLVDLLFLLFCRKL